MLKKTIFFLILVSITFSCGQDKYQSIPLEKLNPKFKTMGAQMTKDIIKSFRHKKGVMYLLDKRYITPKMKRQIKHNAGFYLLEQFIIAFGVGKIERWVLFEVINKGVVKTMRYRLIQQNKTLKFIELKIDINAVYNLVDYRLYVTSEDGRAKRKSVFHLLPTKEEIMDAVIKK